MLPRFRFWAGADAPSSSLESMPTFGWLQIMLFCCMQETGAGGESSFFSLAKYEGYGAVGDREAGDIANIGWVRYDDPETKTFKLNAERQNGRAAMLGITGCLIHELLGVDALYPTGGMGGAAAPLLVEKGEGFIQRIFNVDFIPCTSNIQFDSIRKVNFIVVIRIGFVDSQFYFLTIVQ